jgi:hypothetical protein
VARVETGRDGRIIVVAGQPDHGSVVPSDHNEWDDAA